MTEPHVAFDRPTGRRFVGAIEAFLTSDVRWRARGLFALLIAFALAIKGLNIVNSYVGRDFMTAIAHRDHAGFIHYALLYVGVFAGATVVLVLYQFTQDRLGLFWRVWLTRRILGRYLAHRVYLRIKDTESVANPDERIADDVARSRRRRRRSSSWSSTASSRPCRSRACCGRSAACSSVSPSGTPAWGRWPPSGLAVR